MVKKSGKLENNFYVDHAVMSFSAVPKVIDAIEKTKKLCLKGVFNLSNFIFNDKKVLRSITEAVRRKDDRE